MSREVRGRGYIKSDIPPQTSSDLQPKAAVQVFLLITITGTQFQGGQREMPENEQVPLNTGRGGGGAARGRDSRSPKEGLLLPAQEDGSG